MLQDIIHRAVNAAFDANELERALEEAIMEEIEIDYEAMAEEILGTLDLSDEIQGIANEYAKNFAIDFIQYL